jgi:hypothetical protein
MTFAPPDDMGYRRTNERMPLADRLVLIIMGIVSLLTTFVGIMGAGLGAMALDVCTGDAQPAQCTSWGVTHGSAVLKTSWIGTFAVLGLAIALTASGRRLLGWPLALLAPTLPFFGLYLAFP